MLKPSANVIIQKLRGFPADAVEELRRLLGSRPRWAPVLATAVLSVLLVPGAVTVSAGDAGGASLNPAGIYRALGTSAQQVYSFGVSLANDFQLIYQLHSRLGALATVSAGRTGSISPEGEITNCTASAPPDNAPPQQS